MVEEFNKKIHKKLNLFDKKSKEWEWSDLIKWLTDLKHVVEPLSTRISNEQLVTLSKRLTQCLFPSLPHGLHSKTLEIYEIILKKSNTKQIFILSSGLFQHFQYCAPQNKLQFLFIISENYINPKLQLLIPGLTSCLLSGAGEKQETMTKVIEILDSIQNKQILHFSIWRFILKSYKFRNIGLIYMQKKLDMTICENLIINTVLEALEDFSVINKRLGLDLIKSYYPIVEDNQIVVVFMQGALKLLRGKDHSLIRRLWEWAFPGEIHSQRVLLIKGIIKKALFLIFQENHEKIIKSPGNADEIRFSSIKIVEELLETEGIEHIFIKDIAIIFIKHCISDQLFEFNITQTMNLKNTIKNLSDHIWDSVFDYIDSNLLENEKDVLETLLFSIKYLQANEIIYTKILKKICPVLYQFKNFSEFATLCKQTLQKTLNPPIIPLKHSKKVIKNLIKTNQETLLIDYIQIINILQNNEQKIYQIISYLKINADKHLILSLKAILSFKGSKLGEEDFQGLWTRIPYDNNELFDILILSFAKMPFEWSMGLASLLLSDHREYHIRSFISFWDYASKYYYKQLAEMSRSGKIIFILIDHLSDESPAVRHAAREWLDFSIKSTECIIDPILTILLEANTTKKVNEKGLYNYTKVFDTNRVEDALRKLSLLLLYEPSLPEFLHEIKISDFTIELCVIHGIEYSKYLELCINIALDYIKTSSPFQDTSKVQSSAAEALRLLIKKVPEELKSKTVDKVGHVMYTLLGTKLEYSLLAVFNQLFQQKIEFACPSKTADVLILGLRNDDYYLRDQWNKIISQALPYIINFRVEPFYNYLSLVLINYCDVILKYHDSNLITGLRNIIKSILKFSESLKLNKFKLIKTLILNELERIFLLGLSFNSVDDMKQIVIDITEKFSTDIVIGLIDMWHKYYLAQKLQMYQTILLKIEIPSEVVLDGVVLALESKKHSEVIVASFLYNVVERLSERLANEALWTKVIYIIKLLDCGKCDEVIGWIISIVKILLVNHVPLGKNLKDLQKIVSGILYRCDQGIVKWEKSPCSVFNKLKGLNVLEVIFNSLVTSLAVFRTIWKANQTKLIKIVSDFAKRLLENICLVESSGTIVSKMLSTLIATFPVVFDTFYINTNLAQQLLMFRSTAIKNNLIDILKYSIFDILEKFPDSVEYWYEIIDNIPKHSVFALLDVCDTVFWKTNDYKAEMQERSLAIISLILLSSPKDSHEIAIAFIHKRLDEVLSLPKISDRVFSLVCILIRVLSVRISNFREIWRKVWPELYVGIIKYLKNIVFPTSFQVLKFIDMMIVAYPDFYQEIWIYLYDVSEIELFPGNCYGEYIPAASKLIKGFTARPSRVQRSSTANEIITRQVLLLGKNAENIEDIEQYVKILIQYTMLYSTQRFETDWESVEQSLTNEIVNIQSLIKSPAYAI